MARQEKDQQGLYEPMQAGKKHAFKNLERDDPASSQQHNHDREGGRVKFPKGEHWRVACEHSIMHFVMCDQNVGAILNKIVDPQERL